MGANELTVDKASVLKTVSSTLSAENQLAARVGGSASLVEAQSVQSHGALLASKLEAMKAAVIEAVKEKIAIENQIRVECAELLKRNSALNDDIVPVDMALTSAASDAAAAALREAQEATLGVAAVTEPDSPSSLNAKANMLAKLYKAAKKQTLNAKLSRPCMLLLNKVIAGGKTLTVKPR